MSSAISLQFTVFTGAAALAPVLAGLAIARFGLAGNFFFNSASYLVVIGALSALRNTPAVISRSAGLWRSIRECMQTVRADQRLTWALSGYALLLFATPSMQILLPVLVTRVLHSSAITLGLLLAAYGSGAIAGALLIPWLSSFGRENRLYLGAYAVVVFTLLVIASTGHLGLDLIALLVLGGAQSVIGTLTVTLLQSGVERAMRGRMMSLQTLLNMGVRPLGDFPLSYVIAGIGAPLTVTLSAAVIGSFTLYLAKTIRQAKL